MLLKDIILTFSQGIGSGILVAMFSFGGGWAISQLTQFFKSLIE